MKTLVRTFNGLSFIRFREGMSSAATNFKRVGPEPAWVPFHKWTGNEDIHFEPVAIDKEFVQPGLDVSELTAACKTSPATSSQSRVLTSLAGLFDIPYQSASSLLENEVFSPKTHRESFGDVPTIESVKELCLEKKHSRVSLNTSDSEKVKANLQNYFRHVDGQKVGKPAGTVASITHKVQKVAKSCLASYGRRFPPLHVRFSSPLERTGITMINNDPTMDKSSALDKSLHTSPRTPSYGDCGDLNKLYESINSIGLTADDF